MDLLRKKHFRLSLGLFLLSLACFCSVSVLLRTGPDRLTGAAFCHQIPARSPDFAYPFCYRCAGLFSGIFWGEITFFLIKRNKNVVSLHILAAAVISLVWFVCDILNKPKFPGFHIYPESVSIRFLSAFPLGFFIARLVAGILRYWFPEDRIPNKLPPIAWMMLFPAGAGISYLMIMTHDRVLSFISRPFIASVSVIFLSAIYLILLLCICLIRNIKFPVKSAILTGAAIAMLHISIFGGLHIKYIQFDRILSHIPDVIK